MTHFQPELGQMMHGNSTGAFSMPEYVEALVLHIVNEASRIYWNINQENLDDIGYECDFGALRMRRYWWGDEDAPGAALPNLEFGNVEVRWYKHPGRSMSVNVEQSPEQWIAWFDSVLAHIRTFESLI